MRRWLPGAALPGWRVSDAERSVEVEVRREERAIEGRGEAIVDILAIARPCYGGYEGSRACSLSKGELKVHVIAGPSESGLASTVDDALGPSKVVPRHVRRHGRTVDLHTVSIRPGHTTSCHKAPCHRACIMGPQDPAHDHREVCEV